MAFDGHLEIYFLTLATGQRILGLANINPLRFSFSGFIRVLVILSLWIVRQADIFDPIHISLEDERCHG